MNVGAIRAAAMTAAACSRSRAVQELASIILELLGDESVPESTGPMSPAERAREYRKNKKRDGASRKNVTIVTENVTERDAVSLELSSLSSSPGLILSFSDSQDLKGGGSSESTGAREGGPSRNDTQSARESSTQRVANSGDHARVIEAFAVAFERVRGCKPTIGAKGGAGAKALLRGRTVEEAIAIVARAFEDPFVAEKKPDLAYIASNANAYIGRSPSTEIRARTAVQPVPTTGRAWKVGQ